MASAGVRREKYVQSIGICRVLDQRYVDLPRPESVLQMILTNLRNRPLIASNLTSTCKLVLSLYHSLVTGSKDFPEINFKGFTSSILMFSPFGCIKQRWTENIRPSTLMDAPAGLFVPTAGSSSRPKIHTSVLPEKADLGALKADPRNRVFSVEFDGTAFTRVISSVYCPEGTELANRWRVTDYSADRHVLMSVLCQFTRRSARYAAPLRQEKRKNVEEDSSSSQSPAKKRIRL